MWRCLLVALGLGASVSSAQDACRNDVTDACVHPQSTVHASVLIGTGVVVDRYASVGPSVSLGDEVFVASRAVLAGHLTGPSPDLIAAGTVVGRNARLGHDVTTSGPAVIGRTAVIGDGTTLGADAMLG